MVERVNMIHGFASEVVHLYNGIQVATSVIHPCGGVAVVYAHRPKFGERSDAAHVVEPRPAVNGQPVRCLNCDAPVGPNSIEPEGGWAPQ